MGGTCCTQPACFACDPDVTKCTECTSGHRLANYACVRCSDPQCSCDDPLCDFCDPPHICLACLPGSDLVDGQCEARRRGWVASRHRSAAASARAPPCTPVLSAPSARPAGAAQACEVEGCGDCNGDVNSCTSCLPPLFLYSTANGTACLGTPVPG